MKIRRPGMILICLLMLALALFIRQVKSVEKKIIFQPEKEKSALSEIALHKNFFESEGFYRAVAASLKSPSRDDVEAIVVPHHLLASDFIADMMKRVSGRSIKQAVIIGPNHNNIGAESIAVANAKWRTPFGFAETEEELADKFSREFGLLPNREVFAEEHSVGAILPFVKYYFKDAKILSIVFSSYADTRDVREVSSWLAENLGEDSLVIISTDFSHYLTKDEAEKKDRVTRNLMEKKDIDGIMRLNNDNVDSPASLAVGLVYADKKGLAADFINHANSFDLARNKSSVTTSYFAISYHSNRNSINK